MAKEGIIEESDMRIFLAIMIILVSVISLARGLTLDQPTMFGFAVGWIAVIFSQINILVLLYKLGDGERL